MEPAVRLPECERKRTEDARSQLAAIVESSEDAITAETLERVITTWNDAAQRLYGYSSEEAVGQAASIVLPPGRSPAEEEALEALRQGVHVAHLETVRVRKDGTNVDVSVTFSTIRDREGRIIGISTIARDITERKSVEAEKTRVATAIDNFIAIQQDIIEQKRAQEALRASEIRYRRLFEAAQDGILLLDFETSAITDANPFLLELLGYTREEILGRKLWEIGAFPDVVRSQDNFRRLQRDGLVRYEDLPLVAKSGGGREVEFVSNVYDANGEQVIQCNIRDITERKRGAEGVKRLNESLQRCVAERTAQLSAANKELEAFAYSVAHDLRTPLRGMQGFSQVLLERYSPDLDEQAQDYLQRIRTGALRMGQLIDDLLDLSRISRAEVRWENVDLSMLALAFASDLQKSEPERPVELLIRPGLQVEGDQQLLRVALENLLENAWKFSAGRQPARIEFGVTDSGGRKVYFVRDNGVGFDMAYVGKLFAPFQRLHAVTEFPGTGMGLVTVQRIVRKHGGEVWAEGALAQGATFSFALGERER